MDDRPLIAVKTEVVLDVLVRSMHEEALRRERDGHHPAAPAPAPEDRARLLGRFARELERERFAAARAPMPWLAARVHGGAGPRDVAERLAADEPADRPEPGAGAPASWRVPGPGGHVRHFLALRAAAEVHADPVRGRRAWLAGFFECCVEEAIGADPGSRVS